MGEQTSNVGSLKREMDSPERAKCDTNAVDHVVQQRSRSVTEEVTVAVPHNSAIPKEAKGFADTESSSTANEVTDIEKGVPIDVEQRSSETTSIFEPTGTETGDSEGEAETDDEVRQPQLQRHSTTPGAFHYVGSNVRHRESDVSVNSAYSSTGMDQREQPPITATRVSELLTATVDDVVVAVEAEPLDDEELDRFRRWSRKLRPLCDLGDRRVRVAVALIVFFALLTVILVVVFEVFEVEVGENDHGQGDDRKPSGGDNDGSIEAAESLEVQSSGSSEVFSERFVDVKSIVVAQNVSDPDTFEDTSSPQFRAASWLADEDTENVPIDKSNRLIQRYALAVLFYSSGGASWYSQHDFLSELHECQWRQNGTLKGISACDSEGLVTQLDLADNRLFGVIPRELGSLIRLNSLNLERNTLRDVVPGQLGDLTELTELNLGSNTLWGSLPTEMGLGLGSLTRLRLSDNAFSGSIPTFLGSSLTNLEYLHLDNNRFSGTVPRSFADLTSSIVEISLDENTHLSGDLDFLCQSLRVNSTISAFETRVACDCCI